MPECHLLIQSSFLLAITIAGCLTISFGGMGYVLLPSVRGSKPPTKNYGKLAVTRCEYCNVFTLKVV
jgi:hypothetical protein